MTNPFAVGTPSRGTPQPVNKFNPFLADSSPSPRPSSGQAPKQEAKGESRASASAPPPKGRNEEPPKSPRVTNPFDTSWGGPPPPTSAQAATPGPRDPSPKRNSKVLERALSQGRDFSGDSARRTNPTPVPTTPTSVPSTRVSAALPTQPPQTQTTPRQPSASPGRSLSTTPSRPTLSSSDTARPRNGSTSTSAPAPREPSKEATRERSHSPVYTGGFASTTNMVGRPALVGTPSASTSTSRATSPSAPSAPKEKTDALYKDLYTQSRGQISVKPSVPEPARETSRSRNEIPMNELQLLQKKIDELEASNIELTKEKDSLMVTVNELYGNIGGLDGRCQQLKGQVLQLEEENKNLVFEKSMMVEQLNEAFKEQTKLSSALDEYESILEELTYLREKSKSGSSLQSEDETSASGVVEEDPVTLGKRQQAIETIQKEKKELKQTVKLLEAKLSLLHDQNQHFDKLLVKDQEKIRELEQEKGALSDVYQAAVIRQSDLSDQVWLLEKKLKSQQEKFAALAKPNPKFAIEKLEQESESLYIYSCKSLKDKQLLLKEALLTVNPDVIIFVVSYLHFTLTAELFDAVVMAKEEACAYYLNYLKKSQSPLFKQVCLRNGRLKDLGQYMFENALAVADPQKKVEQLKKCFDFCAKHPQETKQFSRVVEDSLNFAIIEMNLNAI